MLQGLVESVSEALRGEPPGDAWLATGLGGLRLRRVVRDGPFQCQFEGPLCAIVMQGTKELVAAGRRLGLAAGDAMIVSHHIPAVTRIVGSSPAQPYLAAALPLDLTLLAELWREVQGDTDEGPATGAIETMCVGPEILGAFARLLALASTPVEARVLVPLIVREIHLRFLLAPQGGILRTLLSRDSQAGRIGRAIAHIRQGDTLSHSIAGLAEIAGMSTSSFHAHFKAVTGMSPLAFQKELRLMRARDLLLNPEHSVSSVAFAVGYESPTQFSREYARRFGTSPRQHRETVV